MSSILVWPTLMWAKPNLNSLTHNRAWIKRELAGQSNLWLHRNISPFKRNIQTFKGQDTEGDSRSDYKFCRKSLIKLRKEILFQFVKEIQSGALRQRTRGPANCLIGGAGGILIGLSCPTTGSTTPQTSPHQIVTLAMGPNCSVRRYPKSEQNRIPNFFWY